jgi:hypothetical protein
MEVRKSMLRYLFVSAIFGLGMLQAQIGFTNEELIKLGKSGLSEDFIINLVEKEPQKLSADVSRLVALKQAGISDRILMAVVKKAPAQEPLTTPGLMQLVKAGFGDALLMELVDARKPQIDTDPARLAELKQAGMSETLIVSLLRNRTDSPSLDAASVASLTKAGFSERFVLELLEKQKTKMALNTTQLVELKQAGVSEKVLEAMVDRSAAIELPAGTTITVRLIDPIDSSKSNEGDTFKASLEEALVVNGETLAQRGADATVTLATEKNSGTFTGKTELSVALATVTIREKAMKVQSTAVTQESGSQTTSTAKRAAVLGGIGAVVGGIAGGGKGAAIGAGVGAGAGAGSQVFTKGQKVKIPSETVLKFTLENALKVQ